MHRITKQFDFCYGHRVHNQTLDADLSCDVSCACRHLHGHQGSVLISLEASKLEAGMVTDFHHLNWFKQFLDAYLDHKMILDINDPGLPGLLSGLYTAPNGAGWIHEKLAGKKNKNCEIRYPDLGYVFDNSKQEYHDMILGLTLVNFVPTSENLSQFLYEVVSYKLLEEVDFLKDRVRVASVLFCETPKSSSLFTSE
jgi:6-pyruvoyltetrahydropterin/6-carboxytetrahydropterin synthase